MKGRSGRAPGIGRCGSLIQRWYELLQLSQQILGLTDEIHKLTVARAEGKPPTS
jgi:hypothetical protein